MTFIITSMWCYSLVFILLFFCGACCASVDTSAGVDATFDGASGDASVEAASGIAAPELDGEPIISDEAGNWINKTLSNHAGHDDHEFVASMSSDLVEAMLKRKGLKGFNSMISKSCGPGRRSVAHFSRLVECLRATKENMLVTVESFTGISPNIAVRDHVAVTTFCGVLPKIVECKMELCAAIEDCENYSGFLELINQMHTLLIKHYCRNNGKDLVVALSSTTKRCAQLMLHSIHSCWGKAGLDYTDITSVLRRLSKKEKLCQQLVGTQNCLSELYSADDECDVGLKQMVSDISVKIKNEFKCYKYGQEGRHFLGL